jgi:hypothetical protein
MNLRWFDSGMTKQEANYPNRDSWFEATLAS